MVAADVNTGGTRSSTDVSDRPLRILHVVNSLDAGGTERVLMRVAHRLQPRGFEISVCGLARRGSLAEQFPAPERVVSLDKPKGRSVATVWRLNRLLSRMQPNLVHTHNLGPLIYAAPATAMGMLCPILHGEHGQLIGEDYVSPRLRPRRLLYPACRQIHTVSKESCSELISLGFPARKIVAVVNGADTEAFAPGERDAARERLGLPTSGHCLAISARLVRSKRHELLIEAVAILEAHGRDVHLLIAGDGPVRQELEAKAQETGVSSRIRFLGFLDDIQTVYHAADLMVLPSTGEGLSNAILEAMACGTPVLCHDACGCAEVIEDAVDGWMKHIDSAAVLAAHLSAILGAEEELKAVGVAARQKIVTQFDFRNTVDAYERLYRKIASG